MACAHSYTSTPKRGSHLEKEEKEKDSAKSCLTLATLWTVACQPPLSLGFSKQEYCSGLPFPSPGDLPDPGIKPRSQALQADSLPTELRRKPKVWIDQAKYSIYTARQHFWNSLQWRNSFSAQSIMDQYLKKKKNTKSYTWIWRQYQIAPRVFKLFTNVWTDLSMDQE